MLQVTKTFSHLERYSHFWKSIPSKCNVLANADIIVFLINVTAYRLCYKLKSSKAEVKDKLAKENENARENSVCFAETV